MKITFLVSGSIHSNFSYRPLAMARSLRALGHDVSLIAPKADKYNNFIAENISDIDGVRILQPFQFTTKRLEINLLPYLFGAGRLLLREKPDLVYIYKPTPISVIGLISKLFRRTPTVTDFDDLGSEVMRIEGHPAYQRKLVEWSEKLAATYADRLVVASTYLHDMYKQHFPNKPIRIIPNGVESDWFDAVIPSQNPHRIVFMGSINRQNILDPLFESLPNILQKYHDLEVLIIGDGKYLPYFKEKVVTLNISKNSIFTGWLAISEAKKLLHAGDIGYNYMPDEITTRAASNMKVPQYMSRGVVPLVTDMGDLPATVDFGNAGYICKDTQASLAETLLQALQDPERKKKSERAELFAKKELCWENLAAGFEGWMWKKQPGNKTKGPQKIYVVSTSLPGNFGGAEIRNYNLIKQLAKQTDMEVDVFCISSKDIQREKQNFESQIKARCHIVSSKKSGFTRNLKALYIDHTLPDLSDFRSSGLGVLFRMTCQESMPDIVHIEQLHGYYCIREYIPWLKSNGVKIIFDCHNVEFKAFADSLSIFSLSKRSVGKFLLPYLKKLEIEAAKQSDVILACSQSDADFFKMYNKQTFLIANGVDSSEYVHDNKDENPTIIFMGGIGYPPNADAMRFYLTDIYPRIKKDIPHVQFLAIGMDKKWLHDFGIQDSSIHTLGFVDDIRPYLTQASIGICPIRYGSGTRIKIMTYMAAGLPVVSTHKGAEGVGYTDSKNILMADDAEGFAHAVIKLLGDRSYRDIIGKNGRNFIANEYDWNIIGKDLIHIYQHVT